MSMQSKRLKFRGKVNSASMNVHRANERIDAARALHKRVEHQYSTDLKRAATGETKPIPLNVVASKQRRLEHLEHNLVFEKGEQSRAHANLSSTVNARKRFPVAQVRKGGAIAGILGNVFFDSPRVSTVTKNIKRVFSAGKKKSALNKPRRGVGVIPSRGGLSSRMKFPKGTSSGRGMRR